MSGIEVPESLIIGLARDQWMVNSWEDEVHALTWLEQDPSKRVLYRVKVEVLGELGYVPAVPARLAFLREEA